MSVPRGILQTFFSEQVTLSELRSKIHIYHLQASIQFLGSAERTYFRGFNYFIHFCFFYRVCGDWRNFSIPFFLDLLCFVSSLFALLSSPSFSLVYFLFPFYLHRTTLIFHTRSSLQWGDEEIFGKGGRRSCDWTKKVYFLVKLSFGQSKGTFNKNQSPMMYSQ